MQLTPHFTIEEFCVTTNQQYKEKNLELGKNRLGKMYMLAGFAERVREIVGAPMIITSAFRCSALNDAVGGAHNSQHTKCEAIDFVCKGLSTQQIACKIVASDLKYGQLIIEHSKSKAWIHISIGDRKEVLRYKDGKYTLIGELQ